MADLVGVAAIAGLVGVAVVGGSLFAFSTFVMAALARLSEPEGIRAMQHVNRTVYTPWFMVPFGGTAILSLGLLVLSLLNRDEPWWLEIASAAALYVGGVFLVTAVRNVPLNERLARMDADDPDAAAFWRRYLVVWTRWNHVRVAASVLALVQLGRGLAVPAGDGAAV